MSPVADTSTAKPTARFEPRRLCHVNLYVGDVAAAVAFYRDMCGLTVVFEEPGIGAAFLSNGNSHHDVALMQASTVELAGRDGQVQVEAGRGTTPGLNHLAWEIATERELVAAIAAAPEHGVKVERLLDHVISRSAYLADPDGVWLEFYSDSTADWRGVYRQMENQLISARWSPDLDTASDISNITENARLTPVEDAAMRTLRASRAAIVVSSLDQSVGFYTQQLGLGLRTLSAEHGFAILSGRLGLPDLLLLQQQEPSEPLGLHHFGLEVGSEAELDEGARRLEAARVVIAEELSSPAGRALVVRDPDDRLVEFFVVGQGDPWNLEPKDGKQRMYLI
jgi:catechol 2,3-dioxygenase